MLFVLGNPGLDRRLLQFMYCLPVTESNVHIASMAGTPVTPRGNTLQADERVALLVFPAATLTFAYFVSLIRRSISESVSASVETWKHAVAGLTGEPTKAG